MRRYTLFLLLTYFMYNNHSAAVEPGTTVAIEYYEDLKLEPKSTTADIFMTRKHNGYMTGLEEDFGLNNIPLWGLWGLTNRVYKTVSKVQIEYIVKDIINIKPMEDLERIGRENGFDGLVDCKVEYDDNRRSKYKKVLLTAEGIIWPNMKYTNVDIDFIASYPETLHYLVINKETKEPELQDYDTERFVFVSDTAVEFNYIPTLRNLPNNGCYDNNDVVLYYDGGKPDRKYIKVGNIEVYSGHSNSLFDITSQLMRLCVDQGWDGIIDYRTNTYYDHVYDLGGRYYEPGDKEAYGSVILWVEE